jgi:signal transduction histidine kinase
MRPPRSLRARIALAAVASLAVALAIAGALIVRGVESDGRAALDRDLRQRVQQIVRRPPPPAILRAPRASGPGRVPVEPPALGGAPGAPERGGGPGPPPEEARLLVGSGSFVQLTVRGRVVEQRGDVPADAPPPPSRDGLSTVTIGGSEWRALTTSLGPADLARVEVLSSLGDVEHRVANTRRLVILLGLLALAITAVAAWFFTTLAVRPLARLRAGASRVSGAEDLSTTLPEDDGPDEVRSLARTLNEMLARLRASTDAMERALSATRRFAADAGHELRTPLTGMRANLDTLARNPDLPLAERESIVRQVVAEQDRIVHLLDGLQALARGDAAESLPREQVELGDLVDAALYAARRRHPDVTYELSESSGGATLSGWEGGLRLLVDNLLDNAALHGRPGGRVDVGLERSNGALVIRVDDDGPGVAADEREQLLEPFKRGTTASAPGTGLGLAIVAQQAGLHGGEVELGESPRGGLSVRVQLPGDGADTLVGRG